ncbi:chitin synthase I Ecym_6436 [Eremothecium cymbalariae DBVPG|uniref:chitin synthase n=1 Tax=Eremothecium cymbalariae (strain CBS 270.75 / DBVPG 7215 / KCTC 17166 / NRRL Y-17582) TaxID=931890 RepID=G8JUM7_ERECY|nr:hypothetical protein Ecym_6436 [Eremothecium cymbalariae DBVPG\
MSRKFYNRFGFFPNSHDGDRRQDDKDSGDGEVDAREDRSEGGLGVVKNIPYPSNIDYQIPGDLQDYRPNRNVHRNMEESHVHRVGRVSDVVSPGNGRQYRTRLGQFNDSIYYGDVNNVNNMETSLESVGMDHGRHKDTLPILRNTEMQYVYGSGRAYSPFAQNYQNDLEERLGYIDQQGDDYQIISYLDSHGEVVNPYGNRQLLFGYGDGDYQYDEEGYKGSSDQFGRLATNSETNDMTTTPVFGSSPGANTMAFLGGTDEDGKQHDLGLLWTPNQTEKVIRKFKLWHGNFVFDCPISERLVLEYAHGMSDGQLTNEYKFMRYQAVTCEPNDFQNNNFTLRQLKYMSPRRTELMVVITMYNENDILLARTLKGVMDNIKHFTKRKRSSVWGPDAWKKICVCIVSDGRNAINERALALMSALGCYQDGFAKDEINGKKVVAHLYEHTTKINISRVTGSKVKLSCGKKTVPVQLLFCLKERNQKKINSHRWAFEAFSEVLQPEVITLLDAGTMPGKDSIYELWREFNDPNIGGACGEIKTDLGLGYSKLFNPLVASQNFEYKMSNILDKTTESNFGFISVLPGAFSAYRFSALKGEPLKKYFMGENLNSTVFVSNMYLAEDRILCFEIVTKKKAQWLLKYCRSSYGSTDVPERIPEFILQRRRWLNGSFFAALYSFVHFYKIWTSGHSLLRKVLLNIEFLYLFITMLSAWFSLSSFFLVFRILTLSLTISYPEHVIFRVLSVVFLWLYGVNVLITFILSLGNKPRGTPKFYLVTFIFFAILMIYMLFCAIFLSANSILKLMSENKLTFQGLITSETFRNLVISMASTYCLYFMASVVYLQPIHMFTSFIQYVLLSPSYINVLNIYAFCNVHDISWGTKGVLAKPLGKIQSKEDGTVNMEIPVSSQEIEYNYEKYMELLTESAPNNTEEKLSFEDEKNSYLATVRSVVIIFWIISNFIIIAIVLETGGIGQYQIMNQIYRTESQTVIVLPKKANIYFSVILWLVGFMAAVRFLGCCIYMLKRVSRRLRCW